MISKFTNALGNLSIRSKLLVGLLLMALLPIVTLALSGYGFNQYRDVVDTELQADKISTLLHQEQNGILQFLSRDNHGEEIYTEAHNRFLEIRRSLELAPPSRRQQIQSIIDGEQRINERLLMDNGGLFEEFSVAQEDFIEQNNKHVARLLGYKSGWVDPRGADGTEVLGLLDSIRQERIIFDEFNPRAPNADIILQEFRDTNDSVVRTATRLWQQELDTGISRASSTALKSKLQAVKKIVGQITATSFPAISREDARLLGIIQNEETLFGLEASNATRALTPAYETSISDYEKDGGVPLWTRADVTHVGEDVTPTRTLSEFVRCQQGLRVNAEDIFKWKTVYTDDIEPTFLKIGGDLDLHLASLSVSVSRSADRVLLFSIIASAIALVLAGLLVIFFSRVIVMPISRIRDIAVELARGNFNRRAQVKSNDEIGTLAAAFNQMIDHLENSIKTRDREIAERRRVEKDLRDANDRLEIRVEERTTELINANQHLLRELANRERDQEARPRNPLPPDDT